MVPGPFGLDPQVWAILRLVLAIALAAGLVFNGALAQIYLERKIQAIIQDRVGPIHTGPWGLLQTFADAIKLLGKEDILQVQLGDAVRREMTVLFTDIRSFTSLSESMSPEENFRFLNAMLKQMGPLIRQHHGWVVGEGNRQGCARCFAAREAGRRGVRTSFETDLVQQLDGHPLGSSGERLGDPDVVGDAQMLEQIAGL